MQNALVLYATSTDVFETKEADNLFMLLATEPCWTGNKKSHGYRIQLH